MIGRAGRDGNPSSSVIFSNRADLKSCKDTTLSEVISQKENCRRVVLLRGLGDETRHSSTLCCDNCGHIPVPTLRFFRPVKATRKSKPKPIRNLSEDEVQVLRGRLLSERKAIIHSNSAFMALGGALVCPIACIDVICKRANYIKDFSDISNIPGIRTQFAEKFFSVVKDNFSL